MKKSVVVIGAGIAGLAAAARLAYRGHEVHVYEQGSGPGGKIASVRANGYYWDAGPSFFTDKKEFDRLFTECKKRPEDYYQVTNLDEACRYFYPNGSVLHGYDTPRLFAEEIERVFQEPKKHTLAYLDQAANIYRHVAGQFLDQPFSVKGMMKKQALQTMAGVSLDLLYGSMHAQHKKYFRSPEVVALFDRFATYNGSNPYKAPGMLSCLPYLEHYLGAMYVNGGMQSLSQAAASLAYDCGAQFHYDSAIVKVTHSGRRVTGVVTDRGWQPADTIVSAIDINYLYKALVPIRSTTVKKFVTQERSLSAMVFYWGIRKVFPELGLHNILFSSDYTDETKQLWQHATPAKDPTVYINITSRYDRNHAPNGHDNWFVMVNMPSRVDKDWQVIMRQRILKRIEASLGESVEQYIAYQEVRDARHFETSYNAMQGALYGASSNSFRGAFLRHPNRSPDYDNLYTIGVSTHPGGGIPLALRSARIIDGMLKAA